MFYFFLPCNIILELSLLLDTNQADKSTKLNSSFSPSKRDIFPTQNKHRTGHTKSEIENCPPQFFYPDMVPVNKMIPQSRGSFVFTVNYHML